MTRKSHSLRPRRGFTLLETGLATIIIGVGVVAVLQLLAKGTTSQANAVDMTIAVNLTNNIHELTLNLPFTDPTTPTEWGPQPGQTVAQYTNVNAFDGSVFCPPIDARRQTISAYTNWTQSVTVQSVDPNCISNTVPDGSTPMQRVTVSISHLGQTVYQESWLNVSPY